MTQTSSDAQPENTEFVPCPRHGTRCYPEIRELAQRIECAIGLGDDGATGVKSTTERIMMMIEDHTLAELADVDAELNESRLHNDATCSAVAERDRLAAELATYRREPHPDDAYMHGFAEGRKEADDEWQPLRDQREQLVAAILRLKQTPGISRDAWFAYATVLEMARGTKIELRDETEAVQGSPR